MHVKQFPIFTYSMKMLCPNISAVCSCHLKFSDIATRSTKGYTLSMCPPQLQGEEQVAQW